MCKGEKIRYVGEREEMELREIIKRIYHTFLLVWALIGVIMCIMAVVLGWRAIDINEFFALFFITASGSLTYIIFYSKNELSIRQFLFRSAIQLCTIMGILLPTGYFAGLIGREYPLTTIVTIIFTLLVYAILTAIEIYKTWLIADKLNLKLRDRAKE